MSVVKGSGTLSYNTTVAQLSKPEFYGNIILTQPNYSAIQFLTNLCMGVPTSDKLKMFLDKNNGQVPQPNVPAKMVRQREVNFPVVNNYTALFAVIATKTTLGNNLIIGFQNSTDNFFRKDNVIGCQGILGKIIDYTGNIVTIEPFANTLTNSLITSFGGSDFAVSQTATVVYDVRNNNGTINNSSLYLVPDIIKNYAGLSYDTITLNKEDLMQGNFIDEINSAKGVYRFQHDRALMSRFFSKKEKQILSGIGVNNGTYTSQKGIIPLVKTYGTYVPSSTRLTRSTLNNIASQMNVVSGKYDVRTIAVLIGSESMKNITEEIGVLMLPYAGTANTIGGLQVDGLDWKYYQFNGCKFIFINYPPFNDKSLDATDSILGGIKTQHSALFLDLSVVQTDNGVAPALMSYYFDSKKYRYITLPGVISQEEVMSGKMDSLDVNSGGMSIPQIVSTLDQGFTSAIYSDGGIHLMNPYVHAYFEVTV